MAPYTPGCHTSVIASHLEQSIRSFAAGSIRVDALRAAAEQTKQDELLAPTFGLLLEYENDPDLDETELRRRAAALLRG